MYRRNHPGYGPDDLGDDTTTSSSPLESYTVAESAPAAEPPAMPLASTEISGASPAAAQGGGAAPVRNTVPVETNGSFEMAPVAPKGPSPARPSTSDDLGPGTVIGEYHIEHELGGGSMGVVYAAVHPVIGRRAAVKVMSRLLGTRPHAVERFIREARAVNTIRHPNIVDVFSFGMLPDGRCYYIMDLLEGRSLAKRIAEAPLHLGEVADIVDQIAGALHAAHDKGIVHRDLKPENVFLADTPGGHVVKLLDFGIAKLVREEGDSHMRTQTGIMLGTPQYISPEQAMGATVDGRSDVYSLGVICFELVLGRLPFAAKNSAEAVAHHMSSPPPPPVDIWPQVPPDLDRLILRMLAKDPDARPSLVEIRNEIVKFRGSPQRASVGGGGGPVVIDSDVPPSWIPEEAETSRPGVAPRPRWPEPDEVRTTLNTPNSAQERWDTPPGIDAGRAAAAPTVRSGGMPSTATESTRAVSSRWGMAGTVVIALVAGLASAVAWSLIPRSDGEVISMEGVPSESQIAVAAALEDRDRAEEDDVEEEEVEGGAVEVRRTEAEPAAAEDAEGAAPPEVAPEPRPAVIMVTPDPEDARVEIDGVAGSRAEVKAGLHTVVVEAPGRSSVTREVEVSESETVHVAVVLAEKPRKRKRWRNRDRRRSRGKETRDRTAKQREDESIEDDEAIDPFE